MKPYGSSIAGSPLGPNGYVLCQSCHTEAQDISRETAPGWAYHVHHRPGAMVKQAERLEALKMGKEEDFYG